jgi:DNA-binding transcriptional LysR family regulator
MELRHLQYFKTVAEELHFRKAAEKLFISQPPLSRQIKELEDELEAVLFERNNKRVRLTPAGEYLKKELGEIFGKLEEIRSQVKAIHGSVNGVLRIAYISSVNKDRLLSAIKEMHTVYPQVKTKLYELPTIKQVQALEEGKLDLGIMRSPIVSEKLEVDSLYTEPFVLAAPQGLFENGEPGEVAARIKKQPFIFFNKDYAPEYYRKLIEICQRLGFTPDVAHEANNVHSILNLVQKGLGLSLVPHSLKDTFTHLNISFLDLPALPINTEVVIAYKKENYAGVNKWFIDLFKSKT